MAALTGEQWAELRAEWDASPDGGVAWLTVARGGRWDVSEEAIRRRRNRDCWSKPGEARAFVETLEEAAQREAALSHAAADRLTVRRLDAEGGAAFDGRAPDPDHPGAEATGPGEVMPPRVDLGAAAEARDLREQMHDLHRREWRIGRKLMIDAYRLSQGDDKTPPRYGAAMEMMRFAKLGIETMTALHIGEARAWGLEADLLDFTRMTEAQLQAIAAGKLPR